MATVIIYTEPWQTLGQLLVFERYTSACYKAVTVQIALMTEQMVFCLDFCPTILKNYFVVCTCQQTYKWPCAFCPSLTKIVTNL